MNVYLVINPDNGWDNVIAVRSTLKLAVEYTGNIYIEGTTVDDYDCSNLGDNWELREMTVDQKDEYVNYSNT